MEREKGGVKITIFLTGLSRPGDPRSTPRFHPADDLIPSHSLLRALSKWHGRPPRKMMSAPGLPGYPRFVRADDTEPLSALPWRHHGDLYAPTRHGGGKNKNRLVSVSQNSRRRYWTKTIRSMPGFPWSVQNCALPLSRPWFPG